MLYYRWGTIEVDLNDFRAGTHVGFFDVLGRDGALRLHLTNAKSPVRYLTDSQTLVFLSKIRNAIFKRNKATWSDTYARLDPNEFFKENHNRQIATRELGLGGSLKDFLEYLELLSD